MPTSQRKVEGVGLRHLVHFLHQFTCSTLSLSSEDSVQEVPHPAPSTLSQLQERLRSAAAASPPAWAPKRGWLPSHAFTGFPRRCGAVSDAGPSYIRKRRVHIHGQGGGVGTLF